MGVGLCWIRGAGLYEGRQWRQVVRPEDGDALMILREDEVTERIHAREDRGRDNLSAEVLAPMRRAVAFTTCLASQESLRRLLIGGVAEDNVRRTATPSQGDRRSSIARRGRIGHLPRSPDGHNRDERRHNVRPSSGSQAATNPL